MLFGCVKIEAQSLALSHFDHFLNGRHGVILRLIFIQITENIIHTCIYLCKKFYCNHAK